MQIRMMPLMLGLVGAPAGAAPAEPAHVVVLSDFSFRPSQVELRAGEPVVLEFRNVSGSGHSFAAPAFFAAARMSATSNAQVRNGRIEVPAHSQVDVALTPPVAGQYKFKCSHPFHALMGMTGKIVVE